MLNSRDSWGKTHDEVDFDAASLTYPHQVEEQDHERTLDSMIFDSAPSTSTSSPEPQHPLIPGASPSAPSAEVLLARLQQYYNRSVTDTAISPSAPPTEYGRPTYNLSSSVESFASSSLNHASHAFQSPFAGPGSRASVHIHRIPSEDCRALSIGRSPSSMNNTGSGGTMILYRLPAANDGALLVPPASVRCTLGDSMVSLSPDSKYPGRSMMMDRGLVAYAYDPSKDDDTEDGMHDLREWEDEGSTLSWRGFINVSTLVVLIGALLCLFLFYPVYRAFTDGRINGGITRNTNINVTEQAEPSSFDTRTGVWEVDIRL